MKVLVTGATGFVGNVLLKELDKQGHEVVVITRNQKAARVKLPVIAEIHECDLNNEIPSPSFFDGVQAVIHLAGENIAGGRWTASRKKKILNSRKQSTGNLVQALSYLKEKPEVLVSASAVGFYGDCSNEWLNEDSPGGLDFLANVCSSWEEETHEAKLAGIRTVNYRLGVVLGFGGGAMEKMWAPFKLGFGGRLGSGQQWMSWIHVEDVARAMVHAIEQPELSGIYNCVSPNPVTNRTFTRKLEKSMDQKAPFPVPAFALKALAGEMSQILLHSQRVSSKKLCDTGFKFEFPNLTHALREICEHANHEICFAQWVPSSNTQTLSFFEHPENVEKVTPPSMKLKVGKVSQKGLRVGTRIPLSFSMFNVPIEWVTKVKEWKPGKGFSDTQIKGPFSFWNHTHEFESTQGGTLIRDRIQYQLPFGPLGDIVAGSWVRKKLETVFNYRIEKIEKYFQQQPS